MTSPSVATPVAVNTKVMLKTEDSEYFDKETHQSAVGSLLYLSTRTLEFNCTVLFQSYYSIREMA